MGIFSTKPVGKGTIAPLKVNDSPNADRETPDLNVEGSLSCSSFPGQRHRLTAAFHTVIALLSAIPILSGCQKKESKEHYSPPSISTATSSPNPQPPTTQPLTTEQKQLLLNSEVERVMDGINGEIQIARQQNKPPLVVILEDHKNRSSLAKTLGILSRVKDTHGIAKLQLEMTAEVERLSHEDTKTAGMGADVVPKLEGILVDKNLPEAERRELATVIEKARAGVQTVSREIHNQVVIANVCREIGFEVRNLTSGLPPEQAIGKVDDDTFIRELLETDGELIKQTGRVLEPAILVTGELHGLSVAKGLEDRFHVIVVNLSPFQEVDRLRELYAKRGEIDAAQGKTVSPQDKNALEIVTRTKFASSGTVLQARANLGIERITEAFDTAGAVPEVSLEIKGELPWRSIDTLSDP